MRKIFLWVFICLCVGGAFPPTAFSQLLLQEGKVALSLDPGQATAGKIHIFNTTDKEIAIKAYWEDFNYIPPFDGNKEFLPAGTTPLSCSGFVSFSPQEITLGPYGKQDVSYSLRFPKEARDAYYGVLFFENREVARDAATGLSLVTRVGSLFFLERSGAPRTISVKEIAVLGNQITGEIENTSRITLIPQGVFYVMDANGMVLDRGETEKVYLPPGEGAPFFINIPKSVPAGPQTQTLVLTFDIGQGKTVVKEIDFVKERDSSVKILQIRD